jgi:hypothetical protein
LATQNPEEVPEILLSGLLLKDNCGSSNGEGSSFNRESGSKILNSNPAALGLWAVDGRIKRVFAIYSFGNPLGVLETRWGFKL